ncbi:hypothetical protein NKI54_35165 [Mesorhizobium sp. M0663]
MALDARRPSTRFLIEAEGLHKSIVQPLISPTCDHYRALQSVHQALLKSVKEITGKDAPFIRWTGTGPVQIIERK